METNYYYIYACNTITYSDLSSLPSVLYIPQYLKSLIMKALCSKINVFIIYENSFPDTVLNICSMLTHLILTKAIWEAATGWESLIWNACYPKCFRLWMFSNFAMECLCIHKDISWVGDPNLNTEFIYVLYTLYTNSLKIT